MRVNYAVVRGGDFDIYHDTVKNFLERTPRVPGAEVRIKYLDRYPVRRSTIRQEQESTGEPQWTKSC